MSLAIKAIVFDWAGTVVDHGCIAPVIALQKVFAGAGTPITEAEARADMGRAKRDHVRALLAMPRVGAAWREAHGGAPGEADVDALHDAVEPMMRESGAERATLIPGAERLGSLAERGVRIGSTTGYTRSMMADIAPLAAKQGYAPESMICSGETPAGRPSPLGMWKALIELSAWPAWACVKVDDSPVGIEEGRNAGAWTVGIAATGNGVGLDLAALEALEASDRRRRIDAAGADLKAAGADFVIDSIAGIDPILAEISDRIARGERPGPDDRG
ncbi:MAG TPA: phosphonoacetaldehyde hydrolase [Caulobacteraceae bacterium]|jgi:phosphonoacetaldehyde hydrolase